MASIDFQSIGTFDSNTSGAALSPGAPSGLANNDLMLLITAVRTASKTLGSLTGWTSLAKRDTNGTLEILAHIADGVNDAPSPDWDGTDQVVAALLRYNGDIPTIGNLVAGTTTGGGTAGNQTVPLPATTAPSVTDALVFAVARKNKTSNTDGLTISEATEFTLRGQDAPNSVRNMIAVGDWQQSGAGANYDGDDWTHDVGNDAITANAIILYLKPLVGGIVPIASYHYRNHGKWF